MKKPKLLDPAKVWSAKQKKQSKWQSKKSKNSAKTVSKTTKDKTKKVPTTLPGKLLTLPGRAWRNRRVRAMMIGVTLVGVLLFILLLRELPSPSSLTNNENYDVSTQIFDRNGQLLYEIYADENRVPIKLDDLPPHVIQATIAIEDKNFYHHFGFDIAGIVRAIRSNITGNRLEGGSTITQQLVKNALLTNERTYTRKLKELTLSVMTEAIYSKDEILEMYLNYISYGGTAVGIESASQQYFGKSAKELTLAEAALLAGLPQAPSRYSPFQSDTASAKNRQAEVLRRMVEDGYITPAAAQEAEAEPLEYALSQTDIRAPHFVFFVRDLLNQQYGEEMVKTGGLRVTTSLDLELHETAQASLSAEIDKLKRYRVGNGAALIIKPNTGEILSMIGSRDYFDSEAEGQVNVTLAQRQPGSSIKPIMYAAAFQAGVLNPGTVLVDSKTCFKVPGQKDYCPKNYTGNFNGPVTVRQALGNSLNIPAVKALKALGVENFITQANAMGITSWKNPANYGLSLALGGGEVRMIDHAQAFSVLANQGVKVPLLPILKVEDFRGKVLYQADVEQRLADLAELTEFDGEKKQGELTRVMNRAPAYLVSHIMQDNRARLQAFGARSELVIPDQIVSAKTGTTNDLKDNWTVGFTPEFLTVTWVGNNDGTPMNPYLVSGVTGAAPIWNDIMSFILAGREPSWQSKPPDVKSAQVCLNGFPPGRNSNQNQDDPDRTQGAGQWGFSTAGEDEQKTAEEQGTKKIAEDSCRATNTELYWEYSQPSNFSVYTEKQWIDPATGQPPPPDTQVDGLELREETYYVDPSGEKACITCTKPEEEKPAGT